METDGGASLHGRNASILSAGGLVELVAADGLAGDVGDLQSCQLRESEGTSARTGPCES